MADYPFKINITTKDGTKKSFFTASLATNADTVVSSSVMVDRINNMFSASSFIESIEAPSLTSTKYNNASEGIKFLSASVTHPNTGSIIFTDKETDANGGLDHYEFYGTKVCSVLGLPEGVPVYTENFKLSDSSTDTTNYISGEFISDRIALKKGFKMSPQARVQSNLVWDHVFGEGFLQWVSGSTSKMSMGYDNVNDQYKLSAPTASVNRLEAETIVLGNKFDVFSGTQLKIGAPVTPINKIYIGDGELVRDGDTINHGDSDMTSIAMGCDNDISIGIRPFTAGEGTSVNSTTNKMLMESNRTTYELSSTGGVTIKSVNDTTWASSLVANNYQLLLQCHSEAQNSFAGIAFQVGDDDTGGLNDIDAINGAIAVLRDNTTNNLMDGNMIFATNDDADDDLTERMRITHDGLVGIANNNPSTTLDITGTLNVSSNITTGGTVDGVDVATIGGYLNQAVTTTSSPTFTNLNVATSIIHSGDTDTKIVFGTNDIGFDAGGVSILDIDSNDAVFNEGGGNVDVRMEGQSGAGGAVDEAKLFNLDASLGIVCIGNTAQDTDASRLLQVTGNSATDIVRIFNDGNNENRSGMQLRLGTDNGTGTNEYIMFRRGDETAIGLISATSGVVSYGTFTGVHNASILESDSPSANVITGMPSSSMYHEYPQGTIVSMVSSSYDGSLQPVSFVVSSSAHQDKRVFGVYLGSHNWDDDQRSHAIDKHLIMSVGDGYVLVNSQNGNIETGDYITTASGSGGYGCKQNDDLLHNYTVAKACDSVDWSEESTTYKLLACTYHCG